MPIQFTSHLLNKWYWMEALDWQGIIPFRNDQRWVINLLPESTHIQLLAFGRRQFINPIFARFRWRKYQTLSINRGAYKLHYYFKGEKSLALCLFYPRIYKKSEMQLRHNNDSIQSKQILILKLPRSFTTYLVRKKSGNFKIGICFDWIESFSCCLCSR